jgi:hypothetical protein
LITSNCRKTFLKADNRFDFAQAVDWRGKDALAYASKSAAKAKKEDYDQVVKLLEHAIAESSKPLTSDALIHAKSHHHDHHAVAKKTGRGGESEVRILIRENPHPVAQNLTGPRFFPPGGAESEGKSGVWLRKLCQSY